MNRGLFAAITAAAMLAIGPAMAQVGSAGLLPSEQPAVAAINAFAGAKTDVERLALLDRALAVLVRPIPQRAGVLCMRASVLERMKRTAEALENAQQCNQLAPDQPLAMLLLAGLDTAMGRPIEASQLLRRVATVRPDALQDIDTQFLRGLFRQLLYEGRTDIADALTEQFAKAGVARNDPGTYSNFLEATMRHRMVEGKSDIAVTLLPSVLMPDVGLHLLIDRRYQPIWPTVEGWAGGDLSAQRRAYLNAAKAKFQAAPTSGNRAAYAGALFATGHQSEAITTIRQSLSATPDEQSDDWERASAVVALARMLAAIDRRDEGIKAMRDALAGPLGKTEYAVNIAPNLAAHLLLAKRYGEVAPLLDRYPPKPGQMENPAVVGYFVALRACAAAGLNRTTEARRLYDRVQRDYATNHNAAVYATSCVGTPDEQAASWFAAVGDPDRRSDALVDMERSRYRAARKLPVRTFEEAMYRRLIDRADVTKAFDAAGRHLPVSYLPALNEFEGAPDLTYDTPTDDGKILPKS